MVDIVPLHNEVHRDLRLIPGNCEHLANEHVIPVVAQEVDLLGSEIPIAFLKNSETGQFVLVGICGVETGENVFIKDGNWLGGIVPGLLTTAPFRVGAPDPKAEQLSIAIDMESPMISKDEEGQRLFNDDGSLTDYMETRKDNLVKYYEASQLTNMFIQEFVDLDLLEERTLDLTIGGEKRSLNGLYMVSEEKLRALDADKFINLRDRGLLTVIYAHLGSMHHIRDVLKLKQARG